MSPEIRNMSILIQNMLEDSGDDFSEPVPLPGVPSKYLQHILTYCEIHNFQKATTDLVSPLPSTNPSEFISHEGERAFILAFSEEDLINLLLATNFMHVPALFELCCAMIAKDLKGKDFN